MFSHHALVKIVRLTVETNLLTSTYTFDICPLQRTVLTHTLASVGIVSLLMVAVYPVSDLKISRLV